MMQRLFCIQMPNLSKPYIKPVLVVTQFLLPTHTVYILAHTRTHGKPLTGEIMEGNVFHFGVFEQTGTVFPWHPYSLSAVSQITRKTTAVSRSAVELIGCTGTVCTFPYYTGVKQILATSLSFSYLPIMLYYTIYLNYIYSYIYI